MYDVLTVPPGATEKTDAIAVRLDHEARCSVVVMIPYLICTTPRSGSWLLSEGLASTSLAGNRRLWYGSPTWAKGVVIGVPVVVGGATYIEER